MLVHSPEDASCPIVSVQRLIDMVAPCASEATLITSTGAHIAKPQFDDVITYALPVLRKYAGLV